MPELQSNVFNPGGRVVATDFDKMAQQDAMLYKGLGTEERIAKMRNDLLRQELEQKGSQFTQDLGFRQNELQTNSGDKRYGFDNDKSIAQMGETGMTDRQRMIGQSDVDIARIGQEAGLREMALREAAMQRAWGKEDSSPQEIANQLAARMLQKRIEAFENGQGQQLMPDGTPRYENVPLPKGKGFNWSYNNPADNSSMTGDSMTGDPFLDDVLRSLFGMGPSASQQMEALLLKNEMKKNERMSEMELQDQFDPSRLAQKYAPDLNAMGNTVRDYVEQDTSKELINPFTWFNSDPTAAEAEDIASGYREILNAAPVAARKSIIRQMLSTMDSALSGIGTGDMGKVLRKRLEMLASEFDVQ
jgi:hypothetical protein